MSFLKNSWLVATLLSLSSPLLANGKTLFVDGFRAGLYGDLAMDKGPWRNNEIYSALRIKAGVQVIRVSFVGLTLGFQKVGFYTAEKNWTKGYGSQTKFDYRGPVAELRIFPDTLFGLSIAAHQGEGFSYTKGSGFGDFGIVCPEDDKACELVKTERSHLRVKDYSAQVNYNFRPGMQLFFGAGQRQVVGEPEYAAFRPIPGGKAKDIGDYWESFNGAKWKMNNPYFVFGIRGTTL